MFDDVAFFIFYDKFLTSYQVARTHCCFAGNLAPYVKKWGGVEKIFNARVLFTSELILYIHFLFSDKTFKTVNASRLWQGVSLYAALCKIVHKIKPRHYFNALLRYKTSRFWCFVLLFSLRHVTLQCLQYLLIDHIHLMAVCWQKLWSVFSIQFYIILTVFTW